jgi:hypothetical protein
MLEKVSIRFSRVVASIMLLLCPIVSYGIVAYIPQTLKEYITHAHDIAGKGDYSPHLEELCAMIRENRVLASDDMIREAIKESCDILENNTHVITNYFQEYLSSLDNSSILLAMHGDKDQLTSWPLSLFSSSIKDSARDMICLSSELAFSQNLPLCGNADSYMKKDVLTRCKSNMHKRDIDYDDMISYPMYLPTIMFGTGVASPVVNAWKMPPSNIMQYPVTMQFATPGYLHPKKNIMLELHFLVKQHAAPDGTARIRVNGMYAHVDDDGVVINLDSMSMYVIDSNDFLVTEQLGTSNTLRHICVKIRLEKALSKICNAAFLSLTRIEPTSGIEYANDLYLAAAVLRYAIQ